MERTCRFELDICGCWRYWIGMKIGDCRGDRVYYRVSSGIVSGIHMDWDIATMKVASYSLRILEGNFAGGFYVGPRGPKWIKLSGP